MADSPEITEEQWRETLIKGHPAAQLANRIFRALPRNPRCKLCGAPFRGWGGLLMRGIGRAQSKMNPRFCDPCLPTAAGGAEVEISMLFADIRGSTTLAEGMSPAEFGHLIGHFYEVAAEALVESDAMVDRLVGDEVIGLFIPGWAGARHGSQAISAARKLVRRLGYGTPKGPWLPVGIGVHTGVAFVGVVGGGEERPSDFTALGDSVNVTARLASNAAAGEILVSEDALKNAGIDPAGLEQRTLSLKGRTDSLSVYVLSASRSKA